MFMLYTPIFGSSLKRFGIQEGGGGLFDLCGDPSVSVVLQILGKILEFVLEFLENCVL